jgi:hypothetical protein
MLYICGTGTQQVCILGHPVILSYPYEEKACAFQDELIGMLRYAQTIQKAFNTIAEEQKIEVLPMFLRIVQEPLKDGIKSYHTKKPSKGT